MAKPGTRETMPCVPDVPLVKVVHKKYALGFYQDAVWFFNRKTKLLDGAFWGALCADITPRSHMNKHPFTRIQEPVKDVGGDALTTRVRARRPPTKKRSMQPVKGPSWMGAQPKLNDARASDVIFQRSIKSCCELSHSDGERLIDQFYDYVGGAFKRKEHLALIGAHSE
jgi:hypothetical protein